MSEEELKQEIERGEVGANICAQHLIAMNEDFHCISVTINGIHVLVTIELVH